MNTVVAISKDDGYPIYDKDFQVQAGVRVGKLIVNAPGSKPNYWSCTCDCGTVIDKRKDNLKAGALRGGPAAQHNKGTRSCGKGTCDKSGIKNRNTAGQIRSSHTDKNVGGAEIISETDYIDMSNRSTIIVCKCTKCGQPFFTTRRSESNTCGCTNGIPRKTLDEFVQQRGCRSKGELKIATFFDSLKIPYIQEKKFMDCADINPLPFDFYLESPQFGPFVVEFDGAQHFKRIDFFGGEEKFQIQRKHDLMKNRYCWSHGIRIIRIPTLDFQPNLDLSLASTRFEIIPENEQEYYKKYGAQ